MEDNSQELKEEAKKQQASEKALAENAKKNEEIKNKLQEALKPYIDNNTLNQISVRDIVSNIAGKNSNISIFKNNTVEVDFNGIRVLIK